MALQTFDTMTADELLVMSHNGYRYELIILESNPVGIKPRFRKR